MALPSWVPEAETKPAPMPLLVVQSFVNTWEADADRDVLADPPVARRWLAQAGLGKGASEEELVVARAVREALRALLVHNAGGPAPRPSELAPLRRLAAQCRLRPVLLESGELDLRPEGNDGPAGLGALLLVVRDAQQDGTWARLKACRNPECRWAYYDRSHAGRGAWCDMAVCGNRIKNRKLRSRRSVAASRQT